MSLVNDIRAIAYNEATTLAAAVALIAKRRNDVDAAMRAQETSTMPVPTEGAAAERAVLALEADTGVEHAVDRRA